MANLKKWTSDLVYLDLILKKNSNYTYVDFVLT